MDTKELLKKVRKIELKTRRLTNHVFGGEYQSAFKGRGMTFSEVRQYQYGDDVRFIDWNVTARYNLPYVKVFEEERELTLMLLADISGSGFFGTHNQTKSDIITEICATLAFSAIQNNDKVGLILFTDKVELYIPPKKGKFHVLRIIRELIEFKPKHRKTDVSAALKYLSGVQKKKAIVFILSDFMNTGYQKFLQIAGNKHDLTGVRIYDRGEQKIPNLGMIRVYDGETEETLWVNTSSRKTRQRYAEKHEHDEAYYKKSFRKSGSRTIDVEVQDNYAMSLHTYFKSI